jgi:hypothetical protein
MKKLICVTLLGFLFTLTPAISNAATVSSPKAQQDAGSTKHLKKNAHHEKKHQEKKAKKHAAKKHAAIKHEKSV